jgi:hypothetical protein
VREGLTTEGFFAGLGLVRGFQVWLEKSGRGYLAQGLDDCEPGQALLEIFQRAGVRGIGPTDSVVDTLPMAQELIALRCKPKR